MENKIKWPIIKNAEDDFSIFDEKGMCYADGIHENEIGEVVMEIMEGLRTAFAEPLSVCIRNK